MATSKREYVSDYMRARLLANRHGKLMTDQWKDIVTEPLVTLLLLLAPAALLLGPRLVAFTARGLWILVIVAILVVLVPMIARAYRYARAPVQFATLYTGPNAMMSWLFWRPLVLQTETGEPLRFKKRLAPYTLLRPNSTYVVYYIHEHDHYVLLSLAPANHPDADLWQPSEAFYTRQTRR